MKRDSKCKIMQSDLRVLWILKHGEERQIRKKSFTGL
jgi:hypothetical protein